MARKRRKKGQARGIYPLPEGLMEGNWRIKNSQAADVDLTARIMNVPLADTEVAAYARAHEMVHVKITPAEASGALAKKHGISLVALQACEDMRVHKFMQERSIPRAVFSTQEEVEARFEKAPFDEKLLVSLLVSTRFCDLQYAAICAAIYSKFEKSYERILRADELVEHFFTKTLDELGRYCDDANWPLSTHDGFEALTAPVARFFDSLFSEESAIDPLSYWGDPDGQNNWGTLMGPTKIPLTVTRKNKAGIQRTWRDEGVVPAAMHRLTVDNRVFARKRKLPGGTVLIDASGSMNFTAADLAAVISVAPGATIAAYSGRRDYGRLVIVAANGRMATPDAVAAGLSVGPGGEVFSEPMYGNVVDGPALRWLAKQAEPRIWVSDGMVTGLHDATAVNLMHEANATCRQANIERVLDWRTVLEALQ